MYICSVLLVGIRESRNVFCVAVLQWASENLGTRSVFQWALENPGLSRWDLFCIAVIQEEVELPNCPQTR